MEGIEPRESVLAGFCISALREGCRQNDDLRDTGKEVLIKAYFSLSVVIERFWEYLHADELARHKHAVRIIKQRQSACPLCSCRACRRDQDARIQERPDHRSSPIWRSPRRSRTSCSTSSQLCKSGSPRSRASLMT